MIEKQRQIFSKSTRGISRATTKKPGLRAGLPRESVGSDGEMSVVRRLAVVVMVVVAVEEEGQIQVGQFGSQVAHTA